MYANKNQVVAQNVTYTVDMLRLKTEITYEKFTKIEFFLKSFYSNQIKNNYISSAISEFKYNYNIEVDEGKSYWFGFMHNSEFINKNKGMQNPNTKCNFTIEFNPNKIPIKGLIRYILEMNTDWIVKSIDIAMDIPINILDLSGIDKGRKKDFRVFSAGFDNKTYYMGRTNNRIKIYNKKIESNLKYDLTRVEISSKIDFKVKDILFYHYDVKLPELYLNDYMYTFSDYKDKTMLAVLYAVQNGFPLNDLSRSYKNKVKSLLEGKYKIDLQNKYCTEVIHSCICDIFKI